MKLIFRVLLISALGIISFGADLFSDDFNNGLGKWTGRFSGSHNGIIVPDPLNTGRDGVLTFTALNGSGDIYTPTALSSTQPVIIRFDYLGLAKAGSVSGDFGGYLGIVPDLTGNNIQSLAGTSPNPGIELIDDGQWHSYQISMTAPFGPTHLWIEDWAFGSGGGGVLGDAYFDNVRISEVPEPSVVALGFLGFACFHLCSRTAKNRSKNSQRLVP